jgi:hypothetical protein
MIRFLVSAVLFFAAAAVGLLVANVALEDVTVTSAVSFFTAVLVFAVIQAVIAPFLLKITRKHATALMGGVGLLATLVALLTATLVSDGLTITGFQTWVFATLIVWLVTMIASWVLPLIFVKRAVERRRAA